MLWISVGSVMLFGIDLGLEKGNSLIILILITFQIILMASIKYFIHHFT
jgi:hypothetical protein